MIAPEETNGSDKHDASRETLPASTRVYVSGEIHPDIRVPMREIALSDTKSFNGRIEKNAPVRVYDCSGPWGDENFSGTAEEGLPALRREWLLKRGDVEPYDGRAVQPQDNGYLTEKHAEFASKSERANRFVEFPGLTAERRQPLRASAGHPVTQLWYAQQGIITPETSRSVKICIARKFLSKRKTSFATISISNTRVLRNYLIVPTHHRFSVVFPNAFPNKSRRNLCVQRSPLVARSSPLTSITPSVSR
jgi:hypothetical protein